jgi:hypothetical protein
LSLTLSFTLSIKFGDPLLLLLLLSLSLLAEGARWEQQQRVSVDRAHDVRDDASKIYALRG